MLNHLAFHFDSGSDVNVLKCSDAGNIFPVTYNIHYTVSVFIIPIDKMFHVTFDFFHIYRVFLLIRRPAYEM